MKYRFHIAAQLIGVTSITSQILLMREIMLIFHGNELSISLLLGIWLVWTAIGGALMGRFGKGLSQPVAWLAIWQMFVAITVPLSIIGVRECRRLFDALPGEMLSLGQMLLSTLWLVGPLCLLLGAQFVLVCRIFGRMNETAASAIGDAYLQESLGASVAGLLMSVLLVRWLSAWQITLFVCALNLVGCLFVLQQCEATRWRRYGGATAGMLLTALVTGAVFSGAIEQLTLRRQWRDVEVVDSENSVYGNVTVTRIEQQLSFFENGLLLFSTENPLLAEEATHFALLQHPQPRDVLLIGGGVGGTLQEVLKHPVSRLDYVELDPLLIRLALEHLPADDLGQLPAVHLHHVDARLWVQRSVSAVYDAVLLNLPEPFTAQLARFYSAEFFEEAKRVLRPGGVLAFTIAASENYVSDEQRLLLSSLEQTLRTAFASVEALPGEQTHVLAQKTGTGPATLTRDPIELQKRIDERRLETQYVNRFYLPFRLNPMRLRALDALRADPLPETRINRDLQPVAYFHSLLIWLSQFEQRTGRQLGLHTLTRVRPMHLILGILVLLVTASLWQRRHPMTGLVLSVGTTGFSEILFQIVVILSFQVLYGYVYYKLSLILTAFMIGLVLGAWSIGRLLPRISQPLRLYQWTQLAIGLYPLVLLACIWGLHGSSASIPHWLPVQTLFALLPILAGFLGGFQFPLASQIQLERGKEVGVTAGSLYSVDLLGACIGAILGALVLVPLFGLLHICWLVAVLNLGVWVLLLFPTR